MLQRIRQFFIAVVAKINDADRLFIKKHLIKSEQSLFFAMSIPEQRHALNVTYTALKMAEVEKNINIDKLIKCTLLHDVGKKAGDISTTDKVITVLADRFLSNWAKRWGKLGRGDKVSNLRHAFYIYYHHAQYSAEKLIQIGDNEIAEIVGKHHEAPAANDAPELRLLRKADVLN